jgi:hypothetical protein
MDAVLYAKKLDFRFCLRLVNFAKIVSWQKKSQQILITKVNLQIADNDLGKPIQDSN